MSLTSLVLGACVIAGAERPARGGPCDAPEYRQFDFWLGEWDVQGAAGKMAGSNSITRELGDCVLHEHYTTPGGYAGESLNTYDAGRGVWHQTWVDNAGTLLLLQGGLRDGNMVMEGTTTGPDGQVKQHRITWTPNPDGSVRQLWETAAADGAWTTAFDGHYTRK